MHPTKEIEYFARRAVQHRTAAEQAADAKVRAIHERMAKEYELRSCMTPLAGAAEGRQVVSMFPARQARASVA